MTASQDLQRGKPLCLLLLGLAQLSPFTGRQTTEACSSACLGIKPFGLQVPVTGSRSLYCQLLCVLKSQLTNSHQCCGAAFCIRRQVQLQQGPAEVGCMGSHHGLYHQIDV